MTERAHIRGDYLLSPVFLLSLGLLLANDFVLKPHLPSPLSGILSDLAGMVFFPVFLVAVVELMCIVLPRKPGASPMWFCISSVLVGVLLVVVKFTEQGQAAYRALVAPLHEGPLAGLTIGGGGAVADPWDLLALLLIPVPIWVGYRHRKHRNAAPLDLDGVSVAKG